MVVSEFCVLGRIVVCNSQYVGLRITYHDGCPTKRFAIITHENQTKFEIHECSTQLCDMTAGQIVTGIMLPVMRVPNQAIPMYMSGLFDINQCQISVEKVNCHIYWGIWYIPYTPIMLITYLCGMKIPVTTSKQYKKMPNE